MIHEQKNLRSTIDGRSIKKIQCKIISLKYVLGPPRLPLVGSMPFIPKVVRSGEKRMSTYLKETYGPIAGAYVGTRPMVFLTDYNLVKELYKARFVQAALQDLEFLSFNRLLGLFNFSNINLEKRPTITLCTSYSMDSSPLANVIAFPCMQRLMLLN